MPEKKPTIEQLAGPGNEIKRDWPNRPGYRARVRALREAFSADELAAWVQEAKAQRDAWCTRAQKYNAGADLMDAMRGSYDFQYQIELVSKAAGE